MNAGAHMRARVLANLLLRYICERLGVALENTLGCQGSHSSYIYYGRRTAFCLLADNTTILLQR